MGQGRRSTGEGRGGPCHHKQYRRPALPVKAFACHNQTSSDSATHTLRLSGLNTGREKSGMGRACRPRGVGWGGG